MATYADHLRAWANARMDSAGLFARVFFSVRVFRPSRVLLSCCIEKELV